MPEPVKAQASTELAGGVPFLSDEELETALDEAPASPPRATDAIVEENETARLVGLRTALAVLALLALVGLFLTGRIPTRQPAARGAGAGTKLTGVWREGSGRTVPFARIAGKRNSAKFPTAAGAPPSLARRAAAVNAQGEGDDDGGDRQGAGLVHPAQHIGPPKPVPVAERCLCDHLCAASDGGKSLLNRTLFGFYLTEVGNLKAQALKMV